MQILDARFVELIQAAVEKLAQPIDFLATAHVDKIVIDEREICGRLGAPFEQRIAGNSWSVVLREFSVGAGNCK